MIGDLVGARLAGRAPRYLRRVTDLLSQIEALEQALPEPPLEARLALSRLRQAAGEQDRQRAALERERASLLALVERAARLSESGGLDQTAAELLDLVIAVLGAERGLLALVEPGGAWRFVAARSMHGEDLNRPEEEVSRTVIQDALRGLTPVVLSDALREDGGRSRSARTLHLKSVLCLPLAREGCALGFVYLDHRAAPGRFDLRSVETLRATTSLLSVAVDRALRQPAAPASAVPGVLTCSEALAAQLRALARVAPFDVPVLFTGETGSGKGHIARQLHQLSPRAAGPFVHVNGAALPESLVESELFGVEAGAYTGARSSRPGRFELAVGGTLFLDELDSMPLAVQAKLLVALQDRVITRLGGQKSRTVDVRIFAAMGRDPEAAIAQGRLRPDLYYRLSVVTLRVPPLRERPEDIAPLARHALDRCRQRHGLPPLQMSQRALDQLQRHPWPGNVRELENALERAALLATEGVIEGFQLDSSGPAATPQAPSSAERPEAWDRRMVITEEEFGRIWAACGGDVRAVAAKLGVARRSVYRMKARFGL